MKKISYLLIGIFVMFIGLTKTLALDYSGDFFAQPVVITFYLNDSHNALNTRPEEWEFCFEDSEDPDYYKVCLKISDDKVQSFINDMPYPDDVTQYAEFTEEKNDNSMDMYKLEFNWHRVVGTTLGTKNNYKVTIKGITDNSKYNLVSGTPTNITRDTRNYTAYFSLSGLRHIKGTIIFNDENDRDGIREGLLSDFYLGYDGLDKNDLTSEDFLRLRHDVYNSNRYTFEEYVAKYYDNGFTRPKTYTLEFFGPELTKENIIVTKM